MTELVVGLLAGIVLGPALGLDRDGTLLLAVALAVLVYMISCWRFPRRRCWWCAGRRERGDGRGNLRESGCLVRGGSGRTRRLGSVLMGKGRQ